MKIKHVLTIVGALVVTGLAEADYVSEVRQNFESSINDEIVNQIQRELTASYVYQSYASFFGRADIALPGFQKFFSAASTEEREHAQKLIDYVNERGGHVQFDTIDLSAACRAMKDIGRPVISGPRTEACICQFVWTKSINECGAELDKYGLQAMEDALALERYVNEQLLNLHGAADTAKDAHLTHLLEHEFLEEQVTSIRELAGYVTRLRSFKTNYALGEFMFDQKLQ